MSINGISNMTTPMSGYNSPKNNQKAATAGTIEKPDIDKEENNKLTSKMYLATTKSDAAAAYFGSLQEAVKDSKNGFEANRRVNKLTSTHEQIVSSDEYANKADSESIVKDFTDAMTEKRKEIDELVEKRKENENVKPSEDTTVEILPKENMDLADSEHDNSIARELVNGEHESPANVSQSNIIKKYTLNMPEYERNPEALDLSESNITIGIDETV